MDTLTKLLAAVSEAMASPSVSDQQLSDRTRNSPDISSITNLLKTNVLKFQPEPAIFPA